MAIERRRVCGLLGLPALGLAVGRVLPAGAPEPADAAAGPRKRWAMVVDVARCLKEEGCDKCIKACHSRHNVPEIGGKDEVKWIWKEPLRDALPDEVDSYAPPALRDGTALVFCNHCANPPCVRVCPTQATWKRDDGVVMMDWHRCIGCRYCIAACPYGSRSFNWRDPRPFLKTVDPGFPTRTRGVVEKCNLCEERLARGERPACVEACSPKALAFGDLEDAGSDVRKILAGRAARRRKPGLGTEPSVFYLL
jgi:molybdopterin-containing oxidoreductase family iron-sulfur binding subunit